MRRLSRHPLVQSLLIGLFATYLKLVYLTMRWTYEGLDKAQTVWDRKGQGAILAFWHSQLSIAPRSWHKRRGAQAMRVLISRSSDGEFITRTMIAFGFGSIRGSRADDKSTGDKGGAAAFRAMARWVKEGGAVAITPDGPKGPPEVMAEGLPALAKFTGAPVILTAIACNPNRRAKTWDRTVFPLPFSHAAVVWDGPFHASRDEDAAVLADQWGERMRALTRRAEALVAETSVS